MTGVQIKEAIFNQVASRGAAEVAAEIGTDEVTLKSWMLNGRPIDPPVAAKAAELYLNAQLKNRPQEVVMGKPPESSENGHGDVKSVIPGLETNAPGRGEPVFDGMKKAELAGARKLAPLPAPAVTQEKPVKRSDKLPSPNVKKSTKNVSLLFPIYKSVEPATFMTVLAFWDRETMGAELSPGDAMIARSRNRLAKRFLDSGVEWSLWLDDDVVFPCGSAGLYRYLVGSVDPFKKEPLQSHWANQISDHFLNYSTPSRLMSHGKTIVAGCYWDRWGQNTITAVYSQGPNTPFPSDSLHPVDFAGTGCMLVHRRVYEDIAKKFPNMWPEKGECQFFTPIEGPDRMWGEDQSFCHRAKEAGHPTFLDLGLICGHVGSHTYGLPKPVNK